ncbi:MAG: glycogen debranching N-terminal domain-containing protein, partial [Chloroflexia bacterium]
MTTLAQQVVLKEGPIFLLSHENGDIFGNTGLGLYYKDTRYLSLLSLQINEQTLPLLNFSGYRNFMGTFQFANDIMRLQLGEAIGPSPTSELLLLPQTLGLRRSRFISQGLHERIELSNYNRFLVPISLTLQFGSDFRDIFDVRGFPRDTWGELLSPLIDGSKLLLRYKGLDGLDRGTEVIFDLPPDAADVAMPESPGPKVEPGIMVPDVGAPSYHINMKIPIATLTWNFTLEPHVSRGPTSLSFHVMPQSGDEENEPLWLAEENRTNNPKSKRLQASVRNPKPDSRFDKAVHYMRDSYRKWDTEATHFSTDNEDFNVLLKRSKYDLRVLVEPVGDGYFPSAGVPWYVCPFGRDSLITALQTLSLNPQIAIGALRTLARYQGIRDDPWREEEPGKILHELRMGEMARLGMVPHSPYYGSVDSTPLFVLLFVETMSWLDNNSLYD